MKTGGPSLNPGGRSREQRSAARQQAATIQKLTGSGRLTAEFALAVLIAGGEPDEDDEDKTIAKLAERSLRRFGLKPAAVTLLDKRWAAQYLDDRGLGKPVIDVDVTSDGNAIGTVSLIPVDLGALTDGQLADMRRRIQEALPPPDDGDGEPG